MGHEDREPKCQGQHSSSMLALVLLGLVQSSTSASLMKGDSGALPTFAVCVVTLVLRPHPLHRALGSHPLSHSAPRHTKPSPDPVSGTRRPRPPTRQVVSDDLFAAVRARCEAIRAAGGHADGEPSTVLTGAPHGNALRERESSGRRATGNPPQPRLSRESWQRSERSHRGLSSAGGTIVRV